MNVNEIVCMDSLAYLKTLPDNSVHCVVTSPPYLGLRDYGIDGQIGREDDLNAYIARLVEVFREVRRVLRRDGTFWLNIGDSYNGSGKSSGRTWRDRTHEHSSKQASNRGSLHDVPTRLKELPFKSLCGIPWRLAFALQDDGWILRSDIIWNKLNAMPGSYKDRVTTAHEYIFMFVKRTRYWYDYLAIMEPAAYDGRKDTVQKVSTKYRNAAPGQTNHSFQRENREHWQYDENDAPVRNARSVWSIPTQPTSFAHFATFPEALVERCIKVGCPETVCAQCGAPYIRIIEKRSARSFKAAANGANDGANNNPSYQANNPHRECLTKHDRATGRDGNVAYTDPLHEKACTVTKTLGWKPTCKCGAGTARGITLDCFMGSGTTALVVRRLNRDYIGCDLNPDYVELSRQQLANVDPFQPTVLPNGSQQLSLFDGEL